MEQHPIPQQISSYQFKLVGDMTLKQFFQVAGGVVISLIFYSLPLNGLIKWPLILLSAGLGAAMAFLPFQERPLEKWIFAFFRSIYSPTLYSWKKTEKPTVFFTENVAVPTINNVPTTQTTTEPNSKKLEEAEKSFLSKITSLWSNQQPAQPSVAVTNPSVQITNPAVVTLQPIQQAPQNINPPQSANPIAVPQQIPTVITRTVPKLVVEESASHNLATEKIAPQTTSPVVTDIVVPELKEKEMTENQVEFSIDAAPPSPAIAINTIVGQVIDQDRKIVEGAILEIKDSTGRPVRALKSNKAGHFIIVTPLSNGRYEITTEKDGYTFMPVSFETKGEMIPPIAIKGNKI